MFQSLKNTSLALVAALSIVACNDNAPTFLNRPSADPSYAIWDGSSGGNAHFFFLDPIVTNASPAGVFNPTLSPTLEICIGTAMLNGHCSNLLTSFTRQNGIDVPLDAAGQPKGWYVSEWRTSLFPAVNGQTYRLIVLLGDFLAGYVDVTKAADGSWRDTNGVEINASASTLPIRFRLEDGVICGSTADCLETTVTPAGGTFTLDDSTAGATFPVNAVPQPVNLIIEKVTDQPCLPTTLSQYPECFHYSTEPKLQQFGDSVTVAFCMTDPAGWNYLQDGQLRLWKWSEQQGDSLVELARTTVDFLNCPDLSGLGQRSGSTLLRGLAHAGGVLWSPFAWLIGPRDAYAGISYEGGKLSNFSRIGWVRPIKLEISSGDNQTGQAGSTLPLDATVRVTNKYGNTAQPVAGRSVGFVSAASGSAQPSPVVSDAFGLATTNWTLGSALGAYTLTASINTSLAVAPAPYEPQVVFHALAVEVFKIGWLPPITRTSSVTGVFAGGLQPTVTITQGSATLAQLNTVEKQGQYQTTWTLPDPLSAATMRVSVLVQGVPRGYVDLAVDANGDLRNVSTGEKVLNLKNSRSLPIKFALYR
ncbi:MAG TPA: hypothetical protein VF021_03130 [Longimicrobiales bacterium]